ncbi:MAG: hypothetical protein NW216_05090 [Hyphomicrobium sp.]|nr:hypothetical protein [Hyphomicrobium sp.]
MKSAMTAVEALSRLATEQTANGGMAPVNEPEHPLAAELRKILSEPEKHDIGSYAKLVERIMAEMHMAKPTFAPGPDKE